MPGLGADHTPPANVTLADNVEKVSRLLDKMEEQVVLVGHSLGGITISAVAEARRRKLKALVYVCALLPTSGKCGKDMTSLRSEEHTSELQSPCNLVCRLLLEKKKEKE